VPDIAELLAAEAKRQQPVHQPAFAELVLARRRRTARGRGLAGAAFVLVLGAVGGSAVLMDGSPQTAGAPDRVTVTGLLALRGGRLSMHPTPQATTVEYRVAGTVWFRAADGLVTGTFAGRDGRFSVTIAPGRYTVTGRPAYLDASSPPVIDPSHAPATAATGPTGVVSVAPGAERDQPCWVDEPIDVPAGGRSDVQVICPMR
jgi:hypothetical protein